MQAETINEHTQGRGRGKIEVKGGGERGVMRTGRNMNIAFVPKFLKSMLT